MRDSDPAKKLMIILDTLSKLVWSCSSADVSAHLHDLADRRAGEAVDDLAVQ